MYALNAGAQATLKRFWKTVSIEPHPSSPGSRLSITLDSKPLKTPSGNLLLVPKEKRLVATLVAAEWENQRVVLKAHALPMTSITARAVDAAKEPKTRAEIHSALIKYLETDTICFHQLDPPSLVTLQQTHWDPLLDWARSTYNVPINTYFSVLSSSQPAETNERLSQELQGLDAWELAAMERATYTTKSFLIALALVKKHINAEQAALAAQVEVNSQIEKWGEVEDSHDVDYHDVRRQLGSAACLLSSV
ncbi:hypothetical protein JAAARDRAFT_127057 [Jaapia argillacea MUCL 33604]|uniref:ATP12-domain-containing protein n=1 Tax=Jaapia argillacea MUCL 33604 TaxID=933084 RepID=A0A067Q082_9AGAM|nr:hypothetical protein JAAARDRAFT_127057 [Jaapia argillacea MUCL 33604]